MKKILKAMYVIIALTLITACIIKSNVPEAEPDASENAVEKEAIKTPQFPEWFSAYNCLEDKEAISEMIGYLMEDEDFIKLIQAIAEDGREMERETSVRYYVSCFIPYNDPELHLLIRCDMLDDVHEVLPAKEPLRAICEKYGFFPLRSITLYKENTDDHYSYLILFEEIYYVTKTERKCVCLEYKTDYNMDSRFDSMSAFVQILNQEIIELNDHFSVMYINY